MSTSANDGLQFVDPPTRPVDEAAEVLRALSTHPGKWALVARRIPTGLINHWRDARRKVGAQGEFTIRQARGDNPPGFIDVYVRYDDDRA